MASSPEPNPFVGENYDITLSQSMRQLVSEIQNKTVNFSHSIDFFYQLMQSRIDPPLETIWAYSALSFKCKKTTKGDLSNQILISKELFQLISGCSGPCSASKSITLLAPVLLHVYKLVTEVLGKDLGAKRVKKEIIKVKSLIGAILGYVSACCSKDMSEEKDPILSLAFADLVGVWMDGNEDLKAFLPLVSDEIRKEISDGGSTVSYLAGVVISEVFLLKLCLDLRVGNRGVEFEKELRRWIVGSITGFQSFYFFETLVRMLLEPALPVTSLLSLEDEDFLRKILYDAAIMVEYSFLSSERVIDLPANRVRSLAVKRLIITHEAIELVRKNGDQKRAISYTNSFSISRLPSQIIKCIMTSQIGLEEEANRLKGASPKALIKWLLKLDGQGIQIYDDRVSKLHAKLAVDNSKPDSERSAFKPEGKLTDADLLFYIDNKGGKEGCNEDDKEINESMSAAFVAAAKTMRLIEKGGRKRKEGINAGKKKKIKVLKHDLSDNSDSDGEISSAVSDDSSGSGSEVENPSSDEDV
ncbi:uncharacterized protein LOC8265086 [Ricinus communis]|uniref:Uncharacterized protein n=1 Tax=Ricinus communis TaxID=3988 RepID=B9RKB3_RICCO|nr:uncharacterized protein LOC8265086 [Ricinus communis]XP_015571811.1 uncharacterized protein LOC8265086 [Ricinus communis]EEF48111.1 conserved hypothetical protein [Ricinus communis]|eukprot:XP_002514157.1 uncharacterized protein LOC8265086 [Ricinus communis]